MVTLGKWALLRSGSKLRPPLLLPAGLIQVANRLDISAVLEWTKLALWCKCNDGDTVQLPKGIYSRSATIAWPMALTIVSSQPNLIRSM